MRAFRRGRPNVERMRRRGDVKGLERAIRYRDTVFDRYGTAADMGTSARAAAATALGELYGQDGAADALELALRDDAPIVRLRGVEAIQGVGSSVVADQLIHAVAAWEAPPYGDAIELALVTLVDWQEQGLGELFARAAVSAELALDRDRQGRALGQLLAADPRGLQQAARAVTLELLLAGGECPEGRQVELLSWIAPLSVPLLLGALVEPSTRRVAAELLGASRDSTVVEPLRWVLRDPDPSVRVAAATALGEIKDTRAVDTLVEATTDRVFSVREAAGEALDSFGQAGVIAGVTALFDRLDEGRLERPLELAPAAETQLERAERLVTRLLGRGTSAG